MSDFTCFSFYAAKNLTTAEGGMICVRDKKMAEKVKILSLHGMSRDAWKRYGAGGSWHYEVIYPGYKYNMPDILASLGIWQLKKINKFISRKQKIADIYKRELGKIKGIILPEAESNVKNSWYLYPILLDDKIIKIDRNKFIEELKAENIGTSVHFIPVHMHKYYKEKFGFKKGDFPNAEYVFERIISLPIHSAMDMKDAKDVVLAIKKVLKLYE